MNKNIFIVFTTLAIFLLGCNNGNSQSSGGNINVADFAKKLEEHPEFTLIDVRTPGEYDKGHLSNAVNIDWNGADFASKIETLDKEKPVLLYCLSGGRSSSAMMKLKEMGFKEVYNMEGGIMKWRAANMPEVTASTSQASQGMTMQQFQEALKTDKKVLVDFYADWCAPCKKMKPYLEEISKEMADQVVVLRINADDSPEFCKAMKVEALPVLQIYQNGNKTWENLGFLPKEKVVEALNK
jgi:thioredoxin